ncbi:MAG: serine protease, partial [Eubacterium sp.]|nr:serine protease [Eubacterium sp.]
MKIEKKKERSRRWISVAAAALAVGLAAGSVTAVAAEKAAAPENVEAAGSVAVVAYEAMPSLVTISTMSVQEMQSFFGTQKFEAQGAGTGVIVGENDTELLIATNNHVIEDAQEVSVGFIDEEVAEAKIKGTDRESDLA